MNRKIVSLALAGSMVLSSMSSAFAANISDFKDIPKDWSKNAIEAAIQNGLLNGSNGQINASGTLTRAQMAAIVSRVFGATEQADLSRFVDITPNDWYYADMAKAVAMGVFQGSGDRLNPEAAITRQEAFAVLSRAFLLNGGAAGSLSKFSDKELVAAWARETVAAMVSEGYVNGSNGKLNPTGTITRAEFAQIMYNMVKHYDSIDKTVEGNVVLRSDKQIAAGTVIKGDLIIGDGVTISDIKLEGVTVEGRIVMRGGKTVSLSNGAKAAGIVAAKDNTAIKVDSGASVAEITVKADNVSISGAGTVEKVTAEKGSTGTKVTTPNTKITAEAGAGTVNANNGTVEAGKTGMTDKNGNITSGTTTGGGSSGGSSGGGSSSGGSTVSAADSIYNGKVVAPIVMDAAYVNTDADSYAERSYAQIKRAVGDLRQDIAMVTGAIDFEEVQQIFVDDEDKQAERLAAANQNKVPQMVTDTANVKADYAVIVGSINDSPMIQQLIADGKFDEAKAIQGKWEAYAIKEIDNPIDGVKKALVIAGSDARGTVYGIYSISEEIGVSPWYWYSDVPVEVKNKIDVDYTTALVDDGPDVKYRGVFINDEEYANKWASAKFPKDANGRTPEVNYYRHLFELILRMKGNTLWPAMHSCSTAFNMATEDGTPTGTPINAKEAAKYGVVAASAHCEMLLRNNVSEWYTFYENNKNRSELEWDGNSFDYSRNKKAILEYWRQRLQANKNFESILALGLRGIHDGEASFTSNNKFGFKNRVDMQKDVVMEQRKLIAEVYGADKVDQIPQVFIPYKDMASVYNGGLNQLLMEKGTRDVNGDGKIDKTDKFDDVMLMWAEDNYGNVRQVPNAQELSREGGAGVYYHASYMSWTKPKSYLHLNSIQLSLMSNQLHRLYDNGGKDYWILNVGDMKPGDLSAQYFLDMAWDMENNDDTTIPQFLKDWAKESYGVSDQDADTIADVMEQYFQLTGTKRAEFFGAANGAPYFDNGMIFPFSVTADGDEGQRLVDQCNEMAARMKDIYDRMPENAKDAFFEQMYFHVMEYRNVAEEYVYYWKNLEYAKQGRYNSAKAYAELSQKAVQEIWNNTKNYWTINNGKWDQVINPNHDYSLAQGMVLLGENRYQYAEEQDGIGAFAEGASAVGSGTLKFNSLSDDTRYFDVFSRNSGAEGWTAEAPEWVKLSMTEGETSTEQRVLVTIDWSKVTDTQTGDIVVKDSAGKTAATFTVSAVNKGNFDYGNTKGYVEANGYVMVEAEHYSDKANGTSGDSWNVIKSNGQRGDTMCASDTAAELGKDPANVKENGAKLIYNVYFEKAGTYNGVFYRVPTLNEGDGNACRTAIGVGDSDPQLLYGRATSGDGNDGQWQNNMMHMTEAISFTVNVHQGWNQIVVYRSSPSIVFDRFVITTDGKLSGSLVGSEESPNNIAAVKKFGVGAVPKEVSTMKVYAGMTLEVGDGETAYTGASDVRSAESSETQVATVSVSDGSILVTPHRAGTAKITGEGVDGSKITFTVTVQPEAVGGPYLIENGAVVMDASDVLEQSDYAKRKGETGGVHQWELSETGMKCLPDNGKDWASSGTAAPVMQFTFTVGAEDAGDYNLFVNKTSRDNQDSTFFVQMDDGDLTNSGHDYGTKIWVQKGTFHLTEGTHTLSIYARQDGVSINQLYLTKGDGSGLKTGTFLDKTARGAATAYIDMTAPADMNLRSDAGAQEISVSAAVKYGKSDLTLTAASDNTDVATVSVNGGKLTVTPISAGTATITVTAAAEGCADVTRTFKVTVVDAADADKAYRAENGKIVINAVDAMENKPYASHDDTDTANTDKNVHWAAAEDGKSLTLLADSALAWTQTSGLEGNVPSVTFKVNVEQAGDYYLSVFSNSATAENDSYHVVLNNEYKYASKNAVVNGTSQWGDTVGEGWFYLNNTALHLNAGENTLTIYGRESGVLLRQLVLSTEKLSDLSGWQTATLQ